jgi:BirA family biotin operon repressor/biotin-[acetyl-CoA-carboxylase] ligase
VTPPDDVWQLDTQHVGRTVLRYHTVGSTNDLARALASDAAHAGTVVLADAQTAGRGQYGRTWTATPGAGVLLSVLLTPPAELLRPVILTSWAAVAVCEAVLTLTGRQAKVKWPNDVLLHGRKVCGILIERCVGGGGDAVICGIGLNVNQTADDFAAAGLPQAGSLAAACGRPFDVMAVARTLIGTLDREYAALLSGGLPTLEACWKWRVGLLGRPVVAELTDGGHQGGRLLDLTFARVLLDVGDGEVRTLPPEMVRHLHE